MNNNFQSLTRISSDGALSVNLHDSWAGRRLIEALNQLPPVKFGSSLDDDSDQDTFRYTMRFLEMKFQQKQLQEREQRKIELTGESKTITETTERKSMNSNLGTGKVRQMFDQRRQRGTGIDKSYPLKPIGTRSASGATTTTRTTKQTTTIRKQSTVVKQTNNRISSSETTLTTKKPNVLNGNAVISKKRNSISVTDGGDTSSLSNYDLDLNKNPVQLPNIEKLSLEKSVNRDAGGDRNNNNNNNKNNSRPLNKSNIKLKPVVTKKIAPEEHKTNEEGSLSSSSTQLLSPASEKSAPTSLSPKTNSKPTNTSIAKMAAITQRNPAPTSPPGNMTACRICRRHFNVDRIEKHQQICEKAAAKKRKVFDASKHRVKGTEAEQYVRRTLKSSSAKHSAAKQSTATDTDKKADWRRKHEEFIQAIRSAKVMQAHLARGGKLSDLPPPPPSENPDYVQCPHCKRRFNESAAARHIPKCVDMLHNKPKPGAPTKKGAKR